MEDRPIPTRPPSRHDELIQERYIEEPASYGLGTPVYGLWLDHAIPMRWMGQRLWI